MAKKDKVVDLKPKTEKISDEQLKELQNVISNVNKIKYDLGALEAQKHGMLHSMMSANEIIIELQNKFQKEYGTYNINIQDGTINYEDEQADKKN